MNAQTHTKSLFLELSRNFSADFADGSKVSTEKLDATLLSWLTWLAGTTVGTTGSWEVNRGVLCLEFMVLLSADGYRTSNVNKSFSARPRARPTRCGLMVP